jgi:hypothetical protein
MLRSIASLLGLLVSLALVAAAQAAPTAPPHGKRSPHQIWHGYGFLPGYRTPERIEWERARARGYPQFWYGPPRWYHGQWNGGGFGPCWTQTPIGNVWNCGK